MMKFFSCLACCVVAVMPATATLNAEHTVETCGDIALLNHMDVKVLNLQSSTIACDDYTTFEVGYDMILKAKGPVEFRNFALWAKVFEDDDGNKSTPKLTIEPDVSFFGVDEQDTNGGVLSVDKGAVVTFEGTATFDGNSVTKKGGAIHNKGKLKFKKDAIFLNNEVRQPKTIEQNVKGGAIFNAKSGRVIFQGNLYMEFNNAEGPTMGFGGAIFNAGKIDAQGGSNLRVNMAAEGGAIYQTKTGKTEFKGETTFEKNTGSDSVMRGSGLFNGGGLVDFTTDVLFRSNGEQDNIWKDDDIDRTVMDHGYGGAIYNDNEGVITFAGSGKFTDNFALNGGAIYNAAAVTFITGSAYFHGNQAGEIGGAVLNVFGVDDTTPGTIVFSEDYVWFEENGAEACPNIYIEGLDDCPPSPDRAWNDWLTTTTT